MSLITAHRILIGSAVVFFVFFGVRELLAFRGTSETMDLVQGVAALVAAGGFAAYYPTIKNRYRRKS